MKTRTTLLAVMLMLVTQAVLSQSLDDAKKNIYYEHFQTAKQIAQQSASKEGAKAYYYMGLADLGMENADAAKADFEQGIKADANSALNLVGLGRIDIVAGKDYAAAKQKFQKAWELSEGRDIEVLRAILNATAESPKADAQYALDLVTQFKENRKNRKYEFTAEDLTAVGNVYANLPNGGGKAANNFESAQVLDPKYAAAFFEEGNLWDRARQDSLALQYWDQAVQADANYAPAQYQLFTYYRYRDLAKAKGYLDKYMALSDDKVNAQVNLVDVLYLQKNYQQAIDQANELMSKVNKGTQTRLHKLIAVSQLALGDSLQAKEHMDTYFQMQDPEKVLPFDYKTYADIMGKLQQDSMQLVYLNKFVDADTTTNLPFIRDEAQQLSKDGNFKAAELWYQKLFKVADTSQLLMSDYYYRAFSLYGAAYAGLGTYDESINAWKAFTKRFPDQPSGYYYIAMSQQAQDTAFKGLAIDAFNQYISKLDDSTKATKKDILERIYSYMGGVYATQGDVQKAMEYAEKLQTLNPQSAIASNIYSNMAYNAAQKKDLTAASEYAQKALQINPDNATAKQVVDYIKQLKDYQEKMRKYNEAQKKSGQ